MNTLEKLIAKLCPDWVEYKQLGEVCKIEKGVQLNRETLKEDGAYPVINGGINPSGFWDEYNYDAHKITVSQGGASAGYVNWMSRRFWAGAHCFVLTKPSPIVLYRYLFYVVKASEHNLMQSQIGAGIPSVSTAKLSGVSVPIPPLPVQKEIVRMLDDMAGLIDALEEELAARKKQYEWCRERLLTFGDDVEYKPLGEFCSYVRGVTYSKEQEAGSQIDSIGLLRANNIELTSSRLLLEDVKYIKSTVKINSMQWLKKGDILICAGSGSREHIGKVAFIEHDMDFVFGGFMAAIRCKEKLVSKFLFHVLRSVPFKNHLGLVLNSSTINNLKSECVYSFQLPIPPLHVQNKIVHTLDDMTALIAALEEELAARKQQYEYYRDKLLAFKRAG